MPENPDFGNFGRFTETPVEEMPHDMREAYDFTKKLRGMVAGPHKIWLTNPRLARAIVPTGAYFQNESTLAKGEIEIAVNVINGRWGAAYGNYEHELIGEHAGGLEPPKLQALIAGLPTSFEDSRAGDLRTHGRVSGGASRTYGPLPAGKGAAWGRRDCGRNGPDGLVHSCVSHAYGVRHPRKRDRAGRTGLPGKGEADMQQEVTAHLTLSTVAAFPTNSFLENLAVRADGSILVTELLQGQLWYVPRPTTSAPLAPMLVEPLSRSPPGSWRPNQTCSTYTCAPFTTEPSLLHRLDLRSWTPGTPARAERVLEIAVSPSALNGSCLLAPDVILLADSLAGLIWRVDLATNSWPHARVWLRHDSMVSDPDSTLVPPQPGVNGIR